MSYSDISCVLFIILSFKYMIQWWIQDLWKERAGNPNAVMPRQEVAQCGGGGGGGYSNTSFFWNFVCVIYIIRVGVPSACQTEKQTEKQKQKNK